MGTDRADGHDARRRHGPERRGGHRRTLRGRRLLDKGEPASVGDPTQSQGAISIRAGEHDANRSCAEVVGRGRERQID